MIEKVMHGLMRRGWKLSCGVASEALPDERDSQRIGHAYGPQRQSFTLLFEHAITRKGEDRIFKECGFELTFIHRDKASLDIFWLRDETLEESDNLPDPDVLDQEIVDDLEAALEQFREIAADLGGQKI